MQDLQTLTSMARRMALEEVYASLPDNADDEIVEALSWGDTPTGCVLCELHAVREPKEVLDMVTSMEGTILNALIKAYSLGEKNATPKWTDASELPQDGEYSVLAVFSNGGVSAIKMADFQNWPSHNFVPSSVVIHWMSFPKYQEEAL